MISDASRYYGCVLYQIINQSDRHVKICSIAKEIPGFYLVDGRLPFYIKYSTSRKGPWGFNFQISHHLQQEKIYESYGECITAFVCDKDGIVAVPYIALQKILDQNIELQEGISIRRPHGRMYEVRGPAGVLDRKISRNSLFEIIAKISRT